MNLNNHSGLFRLKAEMMRTKLIIISVVLYAIGLQFSRAQNNPIPSKIEHYSTEEGLSHDIVTTIYKDREGFMWFGTWDGLNRFDGQRFTAFRSVAGDSSQLKNNRVDQIREDDCGHLWMKSYDGQIYRFDKKSEQFTSLCSILKIKENIQFDKVLSSSGNQLWIGTLQHGILVLPDLANFPQRYYWLHADAIKSMQIPSDQINFFFQSVSGTKWLGTPKGLVKMAIRKNNTLAVSLVSLPAGCSADFRAAAERNGTLYFLTDKGQLVVYDNSKGSITRIIDYSQSLPFALLASKKNSYLYATNAAGELLRMDPQNSVVKKYQSDEKAGLNSLFEDSHGDLWIEPAHKGILLFDPGKETFRTFVQKNDANNKVPKNHFTVFEDNQQRVWSVLRDGGFGYYDRNAASFRYFYNEPGSKDRLMSNLVSTTFYDPSGIIWLHTDLRGIEKVILAKNNFTLEKLSPNALFKSENEVRGLFCDRRGRLWVGIKDGKILVMKNGQSVPPPFLNEPPGGVGSVYRIYEDSRNNIWLCTKEDGLYMARPMDASCNQYQLTHYLSTSNPSTISSNQIYSVAEDAKGRIWVGSFDTGLSIGDWKNNQLIFTRYNRPSGSYPDGFNKIRHMEMDNRQRVWIATTNGLVIAEERKPGYFKFSKFSKQPGNPQSLGNNDIQHIARGNENTMWLATSGGGLNRVDFEMSRSTVHFKPYTVKDGLANDYVLSCQTDRKGNVWVATKGSISRFDPISEKFRNYNTFDGVPNLGFSEGACQRMADGRLVLGTIQGLIYFSPEKIQEYPFFAHMAFRELLVNNMPVQINGKDRILKSSINLTSRIELKHDQNTISFDFAVLDYRFDNRSKYLYRLAGFDSGWQQNQEQRRATYTNLPPGSYVFEVKSADDGRYKNIPEKHITVIINPPFWKTWWAYLVYGIAIVLIAEFARRTAVTMLRLRQKVAVEKRLTDLKLEFFTNVSHELRTPLTLISNPVDQVLKGGSLSESDRHYLTIVRRNVNRMERYVNQLLDLRKLQNGKARLNLSQVELIGFIREISDCFSGIATSRNVRFDLHTAVRSFHLWIDHDKIETVLYNVLGNAYKFSPANSTVRITLEISEIHPTARIIVEDEGSGVPSGELKEIFKLYYESDHPGSRGSIKGTGIGLALARDLVELHSGKIYAFNRDSKGLGICIELPVKKELLTVPAPIPETPKPSTVFADQPQHESQQPVPAVTGNGTEKPFLLLVEDNEDMQDILYRQLAPYYQVRTASDGEEGLKLALKTQPDLILSDIMMPKMDGIEMLGRIRADQRSSHIPVVLLSAKSAVESQISGLDYGADLYITKPFNTDYLLASIRNLLNQRRKLSQNLIEGKRMVDLKPKEVIVTSKDEIFLQKVISVVEERMADPDFNLEIVAELLNMARPTFYKKFKSLTQVPPVEFVRDMRLIRAKQYLDSGGGNIKEIAYNSGFSSAKYFSTCFKTKYNLSPSDYLKELNGEHSE